MEQVLGGAVGVAEQRPGHDGEGEAEGHQAAGGDDHRARQTGRQRSLLGELVEVLVAAVVLVEDASGLVLVAPVERGRPDVHVVAMPDDIRGSEVGSRSDSSRAISWASSGVRQKARFQAFATAYRVSRLVSMPAATTA